MHVIIQLHCIQIRRNMLLLYIILHCYASQTLFSKTIAQLLNYKILILPLYLYTVIVRNIQKVILVIIKKLKQSCPRENVYTENYQDGIIVSTRNMFQSRRRLGSVNLCIEKNAVLINISYYKSYGTKKPYGHFDNRYWPKNITFSSESFRL